MELLSLLVAFSIFFLIVPTLVATRAGEGSWAFRCAAGFLKVSLFFRIAIMFTGLLRANFTGIIMALWVTWCLGLLIWSHGKVSLDIGQRLKNAFLRLLQLLENPPNVYNWPKLPQVSRTGLLFIVLTAATLLHRSWFPLHNLRFSNIETYSRALDFDMYMHRDTPLADGAAYILAPLGIISGLYADSLIRFSGPLFSTLLVLAVGLCAYRWSRNSSAALLAGAVTAIWPVLAGNGVPGEISSREIAAVYWVLGAAFLRRSRYLTVYAWSTALLISWKLSPVLITAAAAVGLGYLFARFLSSALLRFRWIPAGAIAGVAILCLLVDFKAEAAEGPFEYESAARACRSIASRFPRNEWLIISPVHELVFTYGRGWHFELLDFVTSHSEGQIEPKEFSFPYDVPDIFVFVEKNPLRSPSLSGPTDLTQTMDRAVLAYTSGMGRASIEFKAGALLSAYGMNHADLSVFQEDERLIVFHLKGKRDHGS